MGTNIGMYEIREGLLYSKEHEWVKIESQGIAVVGVSDYAVKQLRDVVYAILPAKGRQVAQMEAFATLESVKAVSDVYSPLTGQVIDVNTNLGDRPELVVESPYDDGWLVKLKVDPERMEEEKKNLLDATGYAKYIETLLKKI